MVTPRWTWHVHFDTDAEELLAGVQVSMVAGPTLPDALSWLTARSCR
jgi:hypothetical protein